MHTRSCLSSNPADSDSNKRVGGEEMSIISHVENNKKKPTQHTKPLPLGLQILQLVFVKGKGGAPVTLD